MKTTYIFLLLLNTTLAEPHKPAKNQVFIALNDGIVKDQIDVLFQTNWDTIDSEEQSHYYASWSNFYRNNDYYELVFLDYKDHQQYYNSIKVGKYGKWQPLPDKMISPHLWMFFFEYIYDELSYNYKHDLWKYRTNYAENALQIKFCNINEYYLYVDLESRGYKPMKEPEKPNFIGWRLQ